MLKYKSFRALDSPTIWILELPLDLSRLPPLVALEGLIASQPVPEI